MALEQELDFFHKHKEELLRHHEGKFALIKGNSVLGTFTTIEEAFEAGVQALGNQSFLIKRIQEEEETIQIPALSVGMISADTQQNSQRPK